jgi:phage protein D
MPDINNVPALSTSRNPRGAVRLNGAVVTGWESWDVDNNAFRAADAFSVVFALHGLPAAFGPPWFGVQKEIDCEIFANEAPDDPDNYKPVLADRLIYGQVDDLEYDAVAGTITLRGRDLTARMIDDKVSVGNLNQTSSQIATQIAANHGLTPVVTATKTKIGTVYNQNASSLKQDRSEWDILSELATFEHFDVFVTGTELHFQPKPKDSGDRYAILWQSPTIDFASPIVNATVLHFERSLTIAKGVSVTVKSWNAKAKKTFSASYPKSAPATRVGQSGASSPLKYLFTEQNQTQDWCQQQAMAHYREITAHMVKIVAEMPGDSQLDCTKIVQVRGTGTAWDQNYFPDSVKRSMSDGDGYRMALTGKNISADVEAAAQ